MKLTFPTTVLNAPFGCNVAKGLCILEISKGGIVTFAEDSNLRRLEGLGCFLARSGQIDVTCELTTPNPAEIAFAHEQDTKDKDR